jgi:radical SAM protein with 4Fe4S-binding SPASM domain
MDTCSSLPQQKYGEFSQWLHRRVGNQHIPVLGSLELTFRCNLRCQHCYLPLERRTSPGVGELSLVEIQRLLDEVTDLGCFWLLLTGGEPLLRPDFADIYTYAKRKGLIMTLFTNGTLLTPPLADLLAEWRPFNIEITLYGATQATYERVTGVPGSYKRCRRGIDLLLERKLPLALKTMVMTLNHHELEQMKSLAASLGVQFHFDPVLHAAMDGSLQPTLLRLTPEEVVQVERSDPDRAREWPKSIQENLNNPISDRSLFLCGAGKSSFHVDALGRLSMCITNRNPLYDLRVGSFKEGWEIFLPQVTSRQYSDHFACAGCNLRSICIQCPAYSEIEYQDAEARVEYLCQLTKTRYAEFAVEK